MPDNITLAWEIECLRKVKDFIDNGNLDDAKWGLDHLIQAIEKQLEASDDPQKCFKIDPNDPNNIIPIPDPE